MPTVRIGRLQVIAILPNLVFAKAIGYSSGIMARAVTNDAWLAMTLSFVTGFLMIAAMAWLAARFGQETPQQYIPRLLGRPLGAVVLFLLALFLFVSFATAAITIEQHINDYLMTETPLIIFVVLYTLLCLYGAYLGIEVAARLALPGLFFSFMITALMVAGAFDHFDTTRLLPLFDHGFPDVLAASLVGDTDVAMATVGVLLLLPLTGKPDRWVRLSWWGLGIGAIMTITWPVFETGVLSAGVAAQYLISCMQMARAAELSIYLHRYEMIMVIFFVLGVITQSVVCLYGACELTAAALPFRLRRSWLYLGAGFLMMPVQYFLAYDREQYGKFLGGPWPAIALPLGFGLPLLLCLVALLRPGVRAKGTGKAAAPPS